MDSRKIHTSVNTPPPGIKDSMDNYDDYKPGSPATRSSLSPSRYGSVEPRHSSVESYRGNTIQDTPETKVVVRHLPIFRKVAYGFGHVFNDLCASMWFTYLLLFFHAVLRIDNTYAGIILLIGQVADAAATPVIGFLCDKTRSRYGRRKTWHLVGTIMVAISFFFFWHNCLACKAAQPHVSNSSNLSLYEYDCDSYDSYLEDKAPLNNNTSETPIQWKVVYFAVPIVIFQFGWAAVQISHLSLIPELTEDENERVGLNAIRYSATIISNVSVFVVMFVLLETVGRGTGTEVKPGDIWIFSGTALGVVGMGSLCSLLFHVGTREPSTSSEQKLEKETGRKLPWYKWFMNPQFYTVAVIYMCTRLIVNLTQVYTPLYLVDSLELNKNSVAIGPLVIYVSGFLMTLILKLFNKVVGRYMVYFLGLAFVWGGLVWFWLLDTPTSTVQQVFVYGSTALIGAGGATILVTSLSMVADLIGCAVGSGAFVYGLMSFTDKISNGIAVAVIQALHPCNGGDEICCPACKPFYRHILVYVPGGASLLACVALASLTIIIFMKSRKCKDVSPLFPNKRSNSLQPTAKDDLETSVKIKDKETQRLLGPGNE